MKRMKTAALLPNLADRDSRDKWESKGALDTQARAMQQVARNPAAQEFGCLCPGGGCPHPGAI